MATRKEIAFIRDARAGNVSAQMALGKRHLFGGAGLKKNLMTSLYWLERAASKSEPEAWLLIGSHVPYEIALSARDPMQLCVWYERAFDAGVIQAGLVWAKLMLRQMEGTVDRPSNSKVLAVLKKVAESGNVEAQWMLAQELKRCGDIPERGCGQDQTEDGVALMERTERSVCEWVTLAASNGMPQAQRAMAELAWSRQDQSAFLHWARPAAHAIAQRCADKDPAPHLEEWDIELLSLYGQALIDSRQCDADEVERYLGLAADTGDKDAQFALGLWYANMDETGERTRSPVRRSRYAKAIHWLTRAGEQGIAKAWHVLYRICLRPNIGLSQHVLSSALIFLERAAESGHDTAQFELGKREWRKRLSKDAGDVRAAYWLQRAAFQGNVQAATLLEKIAIRAAPAPWAKDAQRRITPDLASRYPLLAARIHLAALFGLSVPEMLLIDLNTADCGHCLLVDIRNQYAKSKRRLILIQSGAERTALTQIASRFISIKCGPEEPEGSYRKRLYLFNKLFSRVD